MRVIGHRGSAGTAPENTLAAIRDGLASGADWLEVDVRLVGDQLIVIHDDTLERTTTGRGSVYGHAPETLRKLDAGDGRPIPLLAEIIDAIDGQAGLNVELKDAAAAIPVIELLQQTLQQNPHWCGRFMMSSFDSNIHYSLSSTRPQGCHFSLLAKDIRRDIIDYALALRAYSLNLSKTQLEPTLVKNAQRAGLPVFVYTVNDAADLDRCVELDVDGIYTDYPRRNIALLRERHKLV